MSQSVQLIDQWQSYVADWASSSSESCS